MLKKILLTTLLSASLALSADLYTDTYKSNSGVVKGHVSTGIANAFPASKLMSKRSVAHTSIYFSEGLITEQSQEALQSLLSQARASSYLSVIGHTAGFEYESHSIELSPWAEFWQNIGTSKMMRNSHAIGVNGRIAAVCDYLKENSISASRIYNENRMDRDPISTEATNRGRALNQRVDVVLYR